MEALDYTHVARERRKIAAVQLTWQTWNEVCDFLSEQTFRKSRAGYLTDAGTVIDVLPAGEARIGMMLWVEASQTQCLVRDGDWIIAEDNGEDFYPCTADVFARTYEPLPPRQAHEAGD